VLKTVNEKGISKVETKFIKKDGSFFWAEATPCKYILKGKPIIHVVIRDIKERKQAEEDLRESEEKFKALMIMLRSLINLLDKDGSFIDVNPTWIRTLGYKRDEVIGKFYQDFLHPDYQEHFKKTFRLSKNVDMFMMFSLKLDIRMVII